MRTMKKFSLLIFTLILISATVFPALAQNKPEVSQNNSIQEQVDKLIENYNKALEYELQHGETVTIKDPNDGDVKILAGVSATKLETLWEYTQQQIDSLTARPIQEREKAIQLIRTLEAGQATYLHHTSMPYYDANAEVEVYKTEKNSYTMDVATGQIIEITPLRLKEYSVEPTYSPNELEKKALEFIDKVTELDLDKLTPAFGDKEGLTFFYRWEASTQKLSTGMTPFIQVGFSRGGDFLNYVNTLPFTQSASSNGSSNQVLSDFSEVYANGGSYWYKSGSMSTLNNAGYCYFAGWCSPKNFYYKAGSYSYNANGRWYPTSNSNVKAAAFIPSTHATMRAKYYVYRSGLSTEWWYISQTYYYNTWVTITQEGPISSIWKLKLTNQGSPSREVAWDEVWVYNP